MPFSFQAGLFVTVLVLAGVRFRKSLAAVRLCSASVAGREFCWGRWFHLAVLFGIVLVCLPFLVALALPAAARRFSAAVDRAFGGEEICVRYRTSRPVLSSGDGGPTAGADDGRARRGDAEARGPNDSAGAESRPPPEVRAEAVARLSALRAGLARGRRLAGGALVGAGIAAAALAVAASVAARRRRLLAMSAAATAGFAVGVCMFVLSGRAASRLSGALGAACAISDYASARVVNAGGAAGLAGPLAVVGRPTELPKGQSGYLFLRDELGERASPRAGFVLGPIRVGPAAAGTVAVVRPHVRLAQGGREVFVRSDEDVMVMGFLLDGLIAPEEPYPLVVAPLESHPGGMEGVFEELSNGLAGRTLVRSRQLAALQVVSGAFAAYFAALLLASAVELGFLVRRRPEGAQASPP